MKKRSNFFLKKIDNPADYFFVALLGRYIVDSKSPTLHNRWFKKYKCRGFYSSLLLTDENDFLKMVDTLLQLRNFKGMNITNPFKKKILSYEGFIKSESVFFTKAANTLYKDAAGQFYLENTDVYGVKKSLETLLPFDLTYEATILGSGGAAACAYFHGDKS
jgi:shikimate 5-dehydrogenase